MLFTAFRRNGFILLLIPFCVGVFHLSSGIHNPDAHMTNITMLLQYAFSSVRMPDCKHSLKITFSLFNLPVKHNESI